MSERLRDSEQRDCWPGRLAALLFRATTRSHCMVSCWTSFSVRATTANEQSVRGESLERTAKFGRLFGGLCPVGNERDLCLLF